MLFFFSSCSRWDLSSWPGIEPTVPALEAWGLNHWTAREIPLRYFWSYFPYLENVSNSLRNSLSQLPLQVWGKHVLYTGQSNREREMLNSKCIHVKKGNRRKKFSGDCGGSGIGSLKLHCFCPTAASGVCELWCIMCWWDSGVGDGQGSLACCSPWGHKGLDTTERLNWTDMSAQGVFVGSLLENSWSMAWVWF